MTALFRISFRRSIHSFLQFLWLLIVTPVTSSGLSSSYNDPSFIFQEGGQISAEQVLRLIDEGDPVNLTRVTVTGTLDFTQLRDTTVRRGMWGRTSTMIHRNQEGFTRTIVTRTRPRELLRGHSRVPVTFSHCTFTGNIVSSRSEVDVDTLSGDFESAHLTLQKQVRLNTTTFHAPLIFEGCTFRGEVDLSQAQFRESVAFTGSELFGILRFSGAVFSERADFSGSQFHEGLSISGAEVEDGLILREAVIESSLYLAYSHIAEPVDLQGAVVRDELDLTSLWIGDRPFASYVLETGHNDLKRLLEMVEGSDPVYAVEYNGDGYVIRSSRSSTGDTRENRYDLWRARASVEGADGTWVLKGYLMWEKGKKQLIGYAATLEDPDG